MTPFDINLIRQDFPILQRQVYGHPLVYLDNGATTQKPRTVVEAMSEEYYNVNANVHRGVHFLSQQATELHEQSRESVRAFLNARSTNEIVFTRGTTESLNLVAQCFSEACMQEGDEIIISALEHHSNIVPWQLAQQRRGIRLRIIPITDQGTLCIEDLEKAFNERTRIVSIAHVSNVLGTILPVKEIIRIAHAHQVPVLVDGAQGAPHLPVDVQELDCDFYALSGHKMYGPTGVGVLYGKEEWLEKLPPYMGGGEMIKHVSFEQTTFNELPFKFEAGTPDYVATTGLAKAIEYLTHIGMEHIEAYESELASYAAKRMLEIPHLSLYGPMKEGASGSGPLSFNILGVHHLDVGTLLDRLGIAVRTGHHCAEPLMHRLGVEGTVRISFGLYNTKEEIDLFIQALERVVRMFR